MICTAGEGGNRGMYIYFGGDFRSMEEGKHHVWWWIDQYWRG